MKPAIIPNFLIIGAAKAATTSLSSLLELHPQAAIAKSKEPHFFSYDRHYHLGWGHYLQRYSHCNGEKAIGDASTSYSRIRYYPATVNRIKQHIPDTRIIYMVRHPLERMESAYIEHLCTPKGRVFNSVSDAVKQLPMIVDSSRYWEVFDFYRQSFDESKIKVVWFEEYVTNTVAVFQDVCRFLEIDDRVIPDLACQRANSRQEASDRMTRLGRDSVQINTAWDEEARYRVINLIKEDNLRFLSHFSQPLDYWGDIF